MATKKVKHEVKTDDPKHSDSKENGTKDNSSDLNKVNSLKTESEESKESKDLAHFSKNNNGEGVKFQGLDDDSVWSSESEDEEDKPSIPDGGWGWVVVFAAFLVAACADGLAFSFGLLHEEFTIYFETTQSETSLIGSFFLATPLLAGPIMSALVDRYGCRIMTVVAGLLSTVGFLLAAVSDSIIMISLTLGFLSGLAMGILYVTAVVSVAFWFDKKRNLAVSLASCGMGFGTLVYSPMTYYFLQVYDWRNTVVMLAGTLLNMCVCGALMRDPEWLKVKNKRERSLSRSRMSSSVGSISSRSVGAESVCLTSEEFKSLLKSGKSPEYILATLVTSIMEAEELDATTKLNAEQTYKKIHSVVHLPTFVQQNEKVPAEVIEKLMANKNIYNVILENYPSLLKGRSNSEMQLNVEPMVRSTGEPEKAAIKLKIIKPSKDSKGGLESVVENLLEDDEKNESQIHKNEMNKNNNSDNRKVDLEQNTKERMGTKRDSNYAFRKNSRTASQPKDWLRKQIWTDHHYLRAMPLYRNNIMYRGAMMNIPRYKLRASSLPNIYKNSTWSLGLSDSDEELVWYEKFWNVLKKTFDFKMFTEFHFLMFNVSSLILSTWLIVPYFFLKSYMTDMNIEGAPTMISVIGMTSSVGIVILGWAGDQPWVDVVKTYAVCLIICGVSVALYPPFITNYWVLIVISAVFGFSFASSYSYTPTILMELMPLDRFTVAYGMILMSHGIGELIGPPIGGLLYDVSGSWELTFYAGGAWLVASGLCIGVIAYTGDTRLCGTAPLLKEEADRISKDSDSRFNVHIHI